MITVEGTIQRSDMAGAWALVTAAGTYEIYTGAPAELLHPGLQVRVAGDIKENVMTIAMIGPLLDIKQYEILSSGSQ